MRRRREGNETEEMKEEKEGYKGLSKDGVRLRGEEM